MANRTPYFFYTPTWDYPPPPLGPIKLGNVITSLEKPEQPLYTAVLSEDDSSGVFALDKTVVEFSREKLRQGRFGIVTKFLSIFGFGIDIGGSWDVSHNETFTFDTVTTTQFIPGPSFIQEKCIDASPMVRRWLEKSRYRKPLYVITGLKTVTGAKTGDTHSTHGGSGNLAAEVDGTVWSGGAVPVGGGPEVEVNIANKAGIKWGGGGDFVLAFKVRRVKVSRTTNELTRDKDYTRGAMLENEVKRKEEDEVIVVDEEEVQVDSASREWEATEVMEGEEVVSVGVPKLEEEEEEDDE